MAIYKCRICGYVFDEEKEGRGFETLQECPICKQGKDNFFKVGSDGEKGSEDDGDALKGRVDSDAERNGIEPFGVGREAAASACGDGQGLNLQYDSLYARQDPSCRYMAEIHEMAVNGRSVSGAMGTLMPMPSWDDILILGAQLNPPPLADDAFVRTTTVIGKNAKKPMILENPVYISHMSFGALSKEIKIALAKGSAMAKTAMCSGEGGILPEERDASYRYIFEYIPNKYSVTKENLQRADAIEIKIGQGTKPGMGGHLPGEKVTPEIAELRGKKAGEDIQSPSRFEELKTKDDLKEMVSMLRRESDGRPIGIKLAAGRIERDLEYCVYAEPDFITIDGRGGATGSSPLILRDATSVPTIYALYRARKYLDSVRSDISLVITGGLRVSADFAKAIAMGADLSLIHIYTHGGKRSHVFIPLNMI